MSVAILQSEPVYDGVHGVAEIGFAHKSGETRLDHLYQCNPLRMLFPTPLKGEIPTAVLTNTAGGLVGGDTMDISVSSGARTRGMAMAQAAEKVYRSAGEDSRINVNLTVHEDAWLEWLPQETIVFDGSRLRRQTTIDIQPGAKILAGEILVFGRIASGEKFSNGLLREVWNVRRQGRLEWTDALHLEDGIEETFANPACFNGAKAQDTVVYVDDDPAEFIELARSLLGEVDEKLRGAATVVNGVLVVRWLAHDPVRLRREFGNFWAGFRKAAADLPDALPRLWDI